MTVAVVGSRAMTDWERFSLEMECFLRLWGQFTVASGGARGADSLAARWAREKGLPLLLFRPDWPKHGRSAGLIRNKAMVQAAETVIAFWDGQSKGTRFTIDYAKEQDKQVFVLPVE